MRSIVAYQQDKSYQGAQKDPETSYILLY